MTIKPKKKVTKDKAESEGSDSHPTGGHVHPHPHQLVGHALPHQHGHYHHQAANEPRHEKTPRVRTSPTRWLPSTSSHDDYSHGHSSLSPGLVMPPVAPFDYESHDVPSSHKRRHRSSPHRTVRKHRSHAGNTVASGSNVTPNNTSLLSIQDGVEDCQEEYNSGHNSEDEHVQPPAVPENINEVWKNTFIDRSVLFYFEIFNFF